MTNTATTSPQQGPAPLPNSTIEPNQNNTTPQHHHDKHSPIGLGLTVLGLLLLVAGLLVIVFLTNVAESTLIMLGAAGFVLIIAGVIVDTVYRMNYHNRETQPPKL